MVDPIKLANAICDLIAARGARDIAATQASIANYGVASDAYKIRSVNLHTMFKHISERFPTCPCKHGEDDWTSGDRENLEALALITGMSPRAIIKQALREYSQRISATAIPTGVNNNQHGGENL